MCGHIHTLAKHKARKREESEQRRSLTCARRPPERTWKDPPVIARYIYIARVQSGTKIALGSSVEICFGEISLDNFQR